MSGQRGRKRFLIEHEPTAVVLHPGNEVDLSVWFAAFSSALKLVVSTLKQTTARQIVYDAGQKLEKEQARLDQLEATIKKQLKELRRTAGRVRGRTETSSSVAVEIFQQSGGQQELAELFLEKRLGHQSQAAMSKVRSEMIPSQKQEHTAPATRTTEPQQPSTLCVITPAARAATRFLTEKSSWTG